MTDFREKALDARLDSEARQPEAVDEIRALRAEVERLRRLLDRAGATVQRLAGYIQFRQYRFPASAASYENGPISKSYDEARLLEEAEQMLEALRW